VACLLNTTVLRERANCAPQISIFLALYIYTVVALYWSVAHADSP